MLSTPVIEGVVGGSVTLSELSLHFSPSCPL